MPRCAGCVNEVDPPARFCADCERKLATATLLRDRDGPPPSPLTDHEYGRFLPGTIVGRRYRIVALAGRGGMGEVYRADDLKLGQPVALKFLLEQGAQDADRLRRFHAEVRTARQVAHPSVCRVFDIGEADGQRFISMEYVDGEPLSDLLRRIGRLPPDKALDVARQLCAGVAAAHERGILHGDLKPANVMIDGRGKVRVTDFGLAVLAERARGDTIGAGTPLYMAPEQLRGGPVSVRSEVYSLALILYEIFTGKPAFVARDLEELIRLRSESTPPGPTRHVEGLDPAVERAILQSLRPDPEDRPASVLALAAALPGGDPLRAAIEAGETPSPELIAAVSKKGSMRLDVAWTALAATMVLLVAVIVLSGKTQLTARVPLDKPPEVLVERARNILRLAGHDAVATDSIHGFGGSWYFLHFIMNSDASADRWDALRHGPPHAVRFWYRETSGFFSPGNPRSVAGESDPSMEPGMAEVVLEPTGELRSFELAPLPSSDEKSPSGEVDWGAFFAEAGLDRTRFREISLSSRLPGVLFDRLLLFEGPLPAGSYAKLPEDDGKGRSGRDVPSKPPRVLVDAAVFRGHPVLFRVVYPYQLWPYGDSASQRPRWWNAVLDWMPYPRAVLVVVLIGGTLVLAHKHYRTGRGHRQGALRIAAFAFLASLFSSALAMHHIPWFPYERDRGLVLLALALLDGVTLWVCYMALEPVARRLWPDQIVAWVRFLDGRFRDPLVGRDLLIGTGAGVLGATLWPAVQLAIRWTAAEAPWLIVDSRVLDDQLRCLDGVGATVGVLVGAVANAVSFALILAALVSVLRLLLRRMWLVVPVVFLTVWFSMWGQGDDWSEYALDAWIVLILVLLLRSGVLALVTASAVFEVLNRMPLTPLVAVWWSGPTVVAFAFVAALAAWGFVASLVGRSPFELSVRDS